MHVLVGDGPLMCAEQPALGQRRDPVDGREQAMRVFSPRASGYRHGVLPDRGSGGLGLRLDSCIRPAGCNPDLRCCKAGSVNG